MALRAPPPTASEREEALGFGGPAEAPDAFDGGGVASDIELAPKRLSLVQAATRWLDESTSQRVLDDILARLAIEASKTITFVQLREIKVEFESELAAVIGVVLAHRTVGESGIFGVRERERLAAHYARIMTEMDISPRELRHQVERYREAQAAALEQADFLERVVADRTAQLEAANAQLVEAKQLAEDASSAKSAFLCSVSHEIRTPLTAIFGSVQLALDDELAEQPLVRHLETVESNGEHLLHLLNDILDLSKVESGKLDVERIPTSPRAIAEQVRELVQQKAEERGLCLELRVDPRTPAFFLCDPTRLRQILLNLVSNALKFTAEGTVMISVEVPAERELRVAVSDTGIGMTEEQLGKLFQPFVQAHSSTTRIFGGTGLGLSISRGLAERLGGELEVSSRSGEGSTFTLTLRAVEEVAPPTATSRAAATVLPSVSGRLLLVEDNAVNQRIATAMLQRAGHTVEVAENGAVGVAAALGAWRDGRPFDVVLMDMSMPVMDGYEAVARLREAGYPGSIVALTAHSMESERRRCFELGCDEFSTKPYRRAELFGIIDRLVGERELRDSV